MADPASSGAISPLSFADYNSKLQIAVLKATKNAAVLPADIGFYTSMGKDLAHEVNATSTRILTLTNRLLDLVATGETGSAKGKKRARLESEEDVQDSFRSIVVDAMDQLLERTDIRLDEHRGLLKPPAIVVTTGNNQPLPPKPNKKPVAQGRLDPALQNASHLPKPQIQFKQKVDNGYQSAWQPTIKHKYNAQVPLGYRMSEADMDESTVISSHPYQYEMRHINYPAQMFRYTEPIPLKSFEETPFIWVDTPALLSALLNELRSVTEIAIDLEHHSYRTFSGFVCLMQISTRDRDYIVDTLALRDELEELNEVFTDPKIVKVLHGAESDIIWLQQDFNLYIVNLFDTYHASKVLAFPRHGLATLLEMYCDFTPDKRYQLADWRIRPLPQEMSDYARSDTHFLLYIYDNLRNALLDRSGSRSNTPPDASSSDSQPPAVLLREVLSRSCETALRVYEKETYDAEGGSGPTGWDLLAKKWNKGYLLPSNGQSSRRLEVYKTVHAWRDRVARLEDESVRYVLPNHYLFSLAEQPPADMAALHNSFPSVPPIIRARGKDLLDAIRKTIKRVSSTSSLSKDEETAEAKELGIVSSVDSAPVNIAKNPRANIFAPISRLRAEGEDVPSTQFSMLFGSASNVDRSANGASAFATRRSSLFDFVPSVSLSKRNRFAFRDVLLRIHDDLDVTPSLPKPEVAAVEVVDTEVAMDVAEDALRGQVSMAFVPAEQRQQTRPIVDDTIVVVGQKKRKRVRTRLTQDGELPEAQSVMLEDDTLGLEVIDDGQATGVNAAVDAAPFDFGASGSNILDDGSDHEVDTAATRKKQRKGGSGLFEYGNFKAPPKAHSQLQQGNVSRTIK